MAMGLTCLVVGLVLTADYLRLIPDAHQATLDGRRALSEAVAVQCCLAAQQNDTTTMHTILQALVARNEAVRSAAIRDKNGEVVTEVGGRAASRPPSKSAGPLGSLFTVPIYDGRTPWGTIEISFRPLGRSGPLTFLSHPILRLMVFLGSAAFLAQTFYLKRVLRYLDPSSVVPARVRDALDTLAEGVVILDNDEQIVLANNAFARSTGRTPEELQGVNVSQLPWSSLDGDKKPERFPWTEALRQGTPQTSALLRAASKPDDIRTVSVSAMPIVGAKGERRGVLATFDDVTAIERKNVELAQMLRALRESRDQVQRQNRELHLLATCDPLTSCLNRRSFFEQVETQWNTADRYAQPLSVLMVDIDHFKSINDRFGHSTGDAVLKRVAGALLSSARESDLVCRYGGEEFCVLLPQTDSAAALGAAERFRSAIAALSFENLVVTASLGTATLDDAVRTYEELIDRADKSLYAAKHGGRNRVVSWDQLPQLEELAAVPAVAPESPVHDATPPPITIPFHAVTALTSALAYRDTMTAEHSRQVAEFCVVAARGLMSTHDCYVLEVAAMLHDIGKLAVPDAILLKAGPLTEDEWKIMRTHDHIGAEILEAAFSSPEVTEMVRTHHAWYGGNPHCPDLPQGNDIPLGARIIAIADAFQAIIADRRYRKARTRDAAFAELRRCAGTQFDPGLVERFIDAVTASDHSRAVLNTHVTKQTALSIGLQIERLAIALDLEDFPSLAAMASELAATGAHEGAPQIAELAGKLERAVTSDPDLVNIVRLTTELLDLCRMTQRCYLDVSGAPPDRPPAPLSP